MGWLASSEGWRWWTSEVARPFADAVVAADQRGRIRVSGTRGEGAWRIPVAGTGVGLAVCKRILERHRGRSWFEPNGGGGAVFRFTVPD